MHIYFTFSTTQSRLYQQNYQRIQEILERLGHKVLMYRKQEQDADELTDTVRQKNYRQFLQRIAKCDMMIAEMSYPSSINVGHEVSTALEKNKPVLALYVKDKASTLLEGVTSDRFLYEEYTSETLQSIIERGIAFAEQQTDARFNFFISPKHISFLDYVSHKRRIPKSVYLRELIEHDKNKNRDYSVDQA